jgi:hypothetical protein
MLEGMTACMLSLKHTAGWIAKPKIGSSSEHVANFSMLLIVTCSRLAAEIIKDVT